MQAAFSGISTIWVVIGVGWLIAHLGLVNQPGRRLMAVLAFSVGSPALMFSLVSQASLDYVFSRTVVVNALAMVAAGVVYLVLARAVFRPDLPGTVVGVMASSYTNAGNFGLPIALALLGDATWMAPILLMQVGIVMPICLAILDAVGAREKGVRLSLRRYVLLPFRNPITIGILLGLALNLAGLTVPAVVMSPIDMIGDIAVPLMLLGFGVSLRLDPLPGKGEHHVEAWVTVVIKVVVHPLAAWLIGLAFGLSGLELFAVAVLGALPAAQNVHVIATRYQRAELFARDAVFWSTILSVGSLLGIAALLG